MIRRAFSLVAAAIAVASLVGAAGPSSAASLPGVSATGFTKLPNGNLAYVQMTIADYGTAYSGSITIRTATAVIGGIATKIQYDPLNKYHALVSYNGMMTGNVLVSGQIEVCMDCASACSGRLALNVVNNATKAAIAHDSLSAFSGKVWVQAR